MSILARDAPLQGAGRSYSAGRIRSGGMVATKGGIAGREFTIDGQRSYYTQRPTWGHVGRGERPHSVLENLPLRRLFLRGGSGLFLCVAIGVGRFALVVVSFAFSLGLRSALGFVALKRNGGRGGNRRLSGERGAPLSRKTGGNAGGKLWGKTPRGGRRPPPKRYFDKLCWKLSAWRRYFGEKPQ